MHDDELIRRTKQQMRALVIELVMLSKQNVSAAEFYQGFLDRVVTSLAAYGGAIWTVADGGDLELAYEVNWGLPHLAVIQRHLPWHLALLQKALSSGEPCIIEPSSRDADAEKPGVSTRILFLLAPLMVDGEAQGVVEIFQRAGAPYMTQRGYVQFLLQMCELASDFLKSR